MTNACVRPGHSRAEGDQTTLLPDLLSYACQTEEILLELPTIPASFLPTSRNLLQHMGSWHHTQKPPWLSQIHLGSFATSPVLLLHKNSHDGRSLRAQKLILFPAVHPAGHLQIPGRVVSPHPLCFSLLETFCYRCREISAAAWLCSHPVLLASSPL